MRDPAPLLAGRRLWFRGPSSLHFFLKDPLVTMPAHDAGWTFRWFLVILCHQRTDRFRLIVGNKPFFDAFGAAPTLRDSPV